VDVASERKRLEGELKKAEAERAKFSAKLETPSFTERAPAEVVAKTRALLEEYQRKAAEARAALERLPG
jgi:valyl-tRNA synthetase